MADKKSEIEIIQGHVSFDKDAAKFQELQDKFKEYITGTPILSEAMLKDGKYVNNDPKLTETKRALELYSETKRLDEKHKEALASSAIRLLTKTNNNDDNYESKKMCGMTILQTLVDCGYTLTKAHSEKFQEELVKELTSANTANTRSITNTKIMMGYLSESNLQKVLNTASDRTGNRNTNASVRLESLKQLQAALSDGVGLTISQQKNLEMGSKKTLRKTVMNFFKR